MQTIELDCPPGALRPGALIDDVVKGTECAKLLKEPVSKFFGNWVWEFDIPREKWTTDIQPIIKPRIEKLYFDGLIRYGNW